MILESVDGRHVNIVAGKALDWQWPCVKNGYLSVSYMHVCVCLGLYAG